MALDTAETPSATTMRRLKNNDARDRRLTIFVPAKRLGCILAPILVLSALIGGYMVFQGWEGLWHAELLIRTRRGGRVLLTDAAARWAGLGLMLAGPAFASLPLGLVVRLPVLRIIQATLVAGTALFVAALCWKLF